MLTNKHLKTINSMVVLQACDNCDWVVCAADIDSIVAVSHTVLRKLHRLQGLGLLHLKLTLLGEAGTIYCIRIIWCLH